MKWNKFSTFFFSLFYSIRLRIFHLAIWADERTRVEDNVHTTQSRKAIQKIETRVSIGQSLRRGIYLWTADWICSSLTFTLTQRGVVVHTNCNRNEYESMCLDVRVLVK